MEVIRLVAIIWPASSWGIQVDPDEKPRVARKGEKCNTFTFCLVGPIRNQPGLMLYRTFNFPEAQPVEGWEVVLSELTAAKNQPILYFEDFKVITMITIL